MTKRKILRNILKRTHPQLFKRKVIKFGYDDAQIPQGEPFKDTKGTEYQLYSNGSIRRLTPKVKRTSYTKKFRKGKPQPQG